MRFYAAAGLPSNTSRLASAMARPIARDSAGTSTLPPASSASRASRNAFTCASIAGLVAAPPCSGRPRAVRSATATMARMTLIQTPCSPGFAQRMQAAGLTSRRFARRDVHDHARGEIEPRLDRAHQDVLRVGRVGAEAAQAETLDHRVLG